MDLFPVWAQRLWDIWDIRVLVLVSLALQIILVLLGSRRRYISGIWIRITIWSAYLMADWVATVALGKLSYMSRSIDPNTTLMALWAPLLLVHLGGPDTITAYSVEDNQLWVRHLLGLVVQAAVAVFVIVKCWTSSSLSRLTIPLFFAGIIKYLERTWALWSSVNWKVYPTGISTHAKYSLQENTPNTIKLLIVAFQRFNHLKPHIPSWNNLRPYFRRVELEAIRGYSSEDIFKITEAELGFVFDALYTKAPVIHINVGILLRFISTFCMHFALWKFLSTPKPAHTQVNVTITYVLLVGAVVLDFYALAFAFCFDMAIIWMSRQYKWILVSRLARALAPRSLSKWRPWSNSIGQFNLISSCMIKEPTKCSEIVKFFGMDEHLEKYYRLNTRVEVAGDLKELIVQEVEKFEERRNAQPFNSRGKWALEINHCFETLGWSIESADTARCITLWHIATDLCYYCDDRHDSSKDNLKEMGKRLSDYMMYLLVMFPYMLSTPIRDVRLILYPIDVEILHPRASSERDEASWLLHTEESLNDCCFVNRTLFDYGENRWPNLMGDARRLAQTLLNRADKWSILCSVWVEMMCYAASRCELNYHLQQLRRGGELLTHVWLLLSHREDVFVEIDRS